MLQNMQQGILTVVDAGVVHEEYSIYLESIFETQEIAGRKLMDLIFADTNLGADALSQVDAAVDACLGQDVINFAFNQHLLASEVEKRMPDGRVKTLDLSWSAITDESDTILRLMLCVRDVTELRKLAAEASEQRRNLEMIGEILAVSQEKFQHFIDSSTSFVHENERIIRQYSQADSAAIAALFRNMHTIKGNARTYNLQHLTNVVHETEQTFHFDGLPADSQPVPSLLRAFSAPVVLQSHLSERDWLALLAHDSDPFNRWEAGQRLALRIAIQAVSDASLAVGEEEADCVPTMRRSSSRASERFWRRSSTSTSRRAAARISSMYSPTGRPA